MRSGASRRETLIEYDEHAPLHAVRERAAGLGLRRGSDVADALAVVEDYRRTARELGSARSATSDRTNTSKPPTRICTM